MKILLSWLFDHIVANRADYSVEDIVSKFNKTTAEIEHFRTLKADAQKLSVVKITEIKIENAVAKNVVSEQEIIIPLRKKLDINQLHVVAQENGVYRFATYIDLGGTKDGILPEIFIDQSRYDTIPELLAQEDIVIYIDNKSITHRPDLWSHRGIAREIAAMFDVNLKNIDGFLVAVEKENADVQISATDNNPFSITIEDTQHCKRFSGLYLDLVKNVPTPLWMVIRLARVDCKSMNMFVDGTNYVLFDIGQPMHIFDAEKLCKKRIIIRKADAGEVLETLDDEKTELLQNDIVIADGLHVVSLAGVMGGKESAIGNDTHSIFLESANFDATTIRQSAARHKKRTESSMRFEKSLDPYQNVTAIERYLKLLEDEGVAYNVPGTIQSVGVLPERVKITIDHEFIEKRLGVSVSWQQVQKILYALEFEVIKQEINGNVVYDITVSTFRATKDVSIKEDIVEEVGRFIGYETIEIQLPALPLRPRDITVTNRRREIKKILTYTGKMRELYTYSFFDESFLQSINWSTKNYIEVKNPVSQNHFRLVTTLVPNLLKALQENAEQYKQIRFYEWARIWSQQDGQPIETQVVSGILYDQHAAIDFYQGKDLIQSMYDAIGMSVSYAQIEKPNYPWMRPYQSAHIMYNDQIIGTIGMITDAFVQKLTPGGTVFYFECNAEILTSYKSVITTYKPSSKYPAVIRDISMLTPLSIRVQELQETIVHVDERIVDALLLDHFQKNEWHDKKSVTIRINIQDEHKTLTSEDADAVCSAVYTVLSSKGIEIR